MSNREAAAASERPLPDDRTRIDAALRLIWAGFDDWLEQEKGLARTVWWHAERAASAPQAVPVASQPAASGVDALWVEQAMELARQYAHGYFNHGTGSADGMMVKCREALSAHLSTALTGAQPAPAAPSGYKLVPLEPTQEMIRAIGQVVPAGPYDFAAIAVYRAMLEAAPAAQPADSAMEVDDLEILEAVRREMDENDGGNAPGHGHDVPGIWDSDNGARAGKPCAWCLTWKKFTALIERDRARALTAASKERSKTHDD